MAAEDDLAVFDVCNAHRMTCNQRDDNLNALKSLGIGETGPNNVRQENFASYIIIIYLIDDVNPQIFDLRSEASESK